MTDLGGYGIKLKDRDHTLSIPLDLKYAYNVTDDFKIYAFAGPRFAVGLVYLMKMKQSGTSASVNIYTGKATIKDDGESVSEELDDADFASRFDLQLGLGAGIQYKRVSLEVGYDWGMLNRIKSDYVYDDETVKRSKFVVGLGVSF